MIFNGHSPSSLDEIDEETWMHLMILYVDGMIGNKGIFDACTPITSAIWNYFRQPSSKPFVRNDFYPQVEHWLYEDKPPEDRVSSGLIAWAMGNRANV